MRLHQLEVGYQTTHFTNPFSWLDLESGRGKGGKGTGKAAMSLEFIKTHTASKQATMDFLKLHQVIRRTPPECTNCNRAMNFIRRRRHKVGFLWKCPNKRCGQNKSPLAGSFFEKSHLDPGKALEIIWCWANQMPNKTASNYSNLVIIFQKIS